jgi:murein DD-endopeptidase MepM/ murein hydrolase activator NlpD
MFTRIKAAVPVLSLLFSVSCTYFDSEKSAPVSQVSDSISQQPFKAPTLLFGIPADSFNLVTGYIRPNGFLSNILMEHGITMQEIDQLVRSSSSVFDVRTIRAGKHYTLFCDTDSAARARYLVYEHDPVTCYVFSFNDSLNITPFRKEISRFIKYASGTIETSLWESMIDGGMHPMLVAELSKIFAWTVDFFGLQKGDSFKVIYEELYIGEESLGPGKIYGAEFTWSGKTIQAIPFMQDGRETFFDAEGNSLRRAFLKSPLEFARITSRFSASRLHPILRIRRPHHGVDYAAPVGTPVFSVGDGKVVSAATENGSGKMVRIVHNSVYSTAYLHLSRFGPGITPGAFVKQGDVVGFVGSSGLSTGPHLDFRFYMNGSAVDPLKVEAPSVEPVSEENKPVFEKSRTVVTSLLETIRKDSVNLVSASQ